MQKVKKYSAFLSLLLLFTFSSTLIPFDLFHSHNFASSVCSDIKAKGSCDHKFHLSEKAGYCWICAIHFDKTFNKSILNGKIIAIADASLIADKPISINFTRLIFSTLRGPPAI